MFLCLYGTYTNSHFWTDLNQTLHTSRPWSGRDRRVCMDPKFLTSSTFWLLFRWGPLQNHGHKMAAGATVFRDALISVIPAGVHVTSPSWSCRRRRSHPQQPYIRDSGGSFSNVAEMTLQQTTESSATASYPLFRRVFASRHGYYVQPDDGAIRHSVVSLIPAGVCVTSRILRSTGRRGHPPQRYIPHSSSCFCDLQEITSLQKTVARSYSKCVALSVMRTIH